MQSIETRFYGPGNARGARIKAQASGGMFVWSDWDYAIGSEENHKQAAIKLIRKLGWAHDKTRGDTYGDWYAGGTKNGYVFVCCVDYAKVAL